MSTTITSYDISIDRDGIWAGSGIYDHTATERGCSGNIRDCGAVIGDDAYAAIEDAITEMDAPAGGSIISDGKKLRWSLTVRQ